VLDTNVWISALGWRGVTRRAFRIVLNSWDVVISPPILEEIERVMVYPKLQKVFSASRRKRLLSFIKKVTLLVKPSSKLNLVTEEESDNRFLEAALESGAKVIMAGDRHLIELSREKLLKVFPEGIEILTPREFLDRSGDLQSGG